MFDQKQRLQPSRQRIFISNIFTKTRTIIYFKHLNYVALSFVSLCFKPTYLKVFAQGILICRTVSQCFFCFCTKICSAVLLNWCFENFVQCQEYCYVLFLQKQILNMQVNMCRYMKLNRTLGDISIEQFINRLKQTLFVSSK